MPEPTGAVVLRRRTLAGTIRYVAEKLPGTIPDEAARLALQLVLHQAADRADTDARQAEIYRNEAAGRERALATLQRVRAALDRLGPLLPESEGPSPAGVPTATLSRSSHLHGPGAPYADSGAWVLSQIRQALEESSADG